MQSLPKFHGVAPALVTPMNEDRSINWDGLKKLIQHVSNGGVDYLVVQGTTGESPALSKSEKLEVLKTVQEVNNGRVKIVFGVGGNNTLEVGSFLKELPAGIDGVLSVSPYYNKPSQKGIIEHFKYLSGCTNLPIILYNVPGRTGSNILAETTLTLAEIPNIVAIKEAKGDIVQAMELIGKAPEDFLVISGDDMIALPMTLAGGAGVISVIAQGFPRAFSDMIHLALQRKVDKAYAIHYKIAPAIDYIFEQGNPAGIKAVFAALNLCEPTLRLPLVEVDAVLNAKIKTFVHAF